MQEHPILFSTPMVQAILEERKTQTRRVIKGQTEDWYQLKSEYTTANSVVWIVTGKPIDQNKLSPIITSVECPYGQIGDRLWVRESYSYYHSIKDEQGNPKIAYKADIYDSGLKSFKWKPSIHMPRSASRITLEIADIRVELLQDISEEDAVKEGCTKCLYPCSAFKKLWDSINAKKYTWESNPLVWVIEFKQINMELK